MKSLVILAGGKSSRMGQDKVMLKLDGQTLIEHIYLNALANFGRIIISTDTEKHAEAIRKLPAFAGKEPEIVTDSYEAVGPMGGIRTVFEKTDVDRFSIISVDVPFADMNVLEALYDSCTKKAVFLKMGEKKAEPLIAAYDRSAYQNIKNGIEAGLFKMRMVIGEDDLDIIQADELAERFGNLKGIDFMASFRNFNTPEEFAAI